MLLYLEILSKIPISNIETSKLEPPYDKKGSVTPVTGIKPTTTIRFNIAWNAKLKVMPKARYFGNLSSWLIDILNPR